MTELKCPFCQQELRKIHPTYIICDNCRITGEDKIWQALIDTKKKLDIAVDALTIIRRYTAINQFQPKSREAHIIAKKVLAEINKKEQ